MLSRQRHRKSTYYVQGSLSEETVCNYTKQLVDAVGYMQDRKIVHR